MLSVYKKKIRQEIHGVKTSLDNLIDLRSELQGMGLVEKDFVKQQQKMLEVEILDKFIIDVEEKISHLYSLLEIRR